MVIYVGIKASDIQIPIWLRFGSVKNFYFNKYKIYEWNIDYNEHILITMNTYWALYY